MRVKFNVINLYHCEKSFDSGPRIFDYGYFLYNHRGCGSFIIGGRNFYMKEGDICFCPPHISNVIIADDNDPFVLSGIEFDFLTEYETGCLPEHYSVYSCDCFVKQSVNEMLKEYSFGKAGYQEICTCLLTAMCMKLARYSPADHNREQIAAGVISYLNDNYTKNVTHKELGEMFNYHRNSINNLLKRATGMTVKQYLVEIRLKHAVTFLKYSNKAVFQIAELCGYNSTAFFIRQFKEKTGVTPNQYRQQISASVCSAADPDTIINSNNGTL